jgi:hypothetical protein
MESKELEQKLEALEKELTKERKKVADQNSYITELESRRAPVSNAPTQQSSTAVDPALQQYLEKKMREEVIAEATVEINKSFSEQEVAAVMPDLLAFLKANMNKKNTTVGFIIDAFDLMYARAMKNKSHEINKIGKSGTPTDTPVDVKTNAKVLNAVQEQTLKANPTVISPSDGTAGSPPDATTNVKSTKDAFQALKNRFNENGGNKFK